MIQKQKMQKIISISFLSLDINNKFWKILLKNFQGKLDKIR